MMKRNETEEKGGERIDRAKQIAILLSDYQNLIFSLCYQMTQNYFEAEDLAQETFVAAYEHLDSFDGQHEKAWLCRIAMNKCLDFQRKNRRGAIPQDENVFLELADGENVENKVLAEEVQAELWRACESLKSGLTGHCSGVFLSGRKVPRILPQSRTKTSKRCRHRLPCPCQITENIRKGADAMGQRFTEEQLEQMIMQLEQGGLLQAPPSLERGVMEKIARLEEENQADIRFSSKTKRFFYQLKIGAAMAASLVLLALPMGHGSYEESPYGKAQQMVQEEEEKESLLDYMQQGTKILSDGVTAFPVSQ